MELQHAEDDKDGHADPLAVLQVEDFRQQGGEHDCQAEAEGVDMAAIAVAFVGVEPAFGKMEAFGLGRHVVRRISMWGCKL